MEQELNDLIKDILLKNQDKLAIPMRKLSKFEGWLKIELAGALAEKYKDTEVEFCFDKKFIDIHSNHSYIELKTQSSNYERKKTNASPRPITDNINKIIKDVKKLNELNLTPGYIAFTLYPLDENKRHLEQINNITSYIQGSFSNSKIVVSTLIINGIETLIYTARVN